MLDLFKEIIKLLNTLLQMNIGLQARLQSLEGRMDEFDLALKEIGDEMAQDAEAIKAAEEKSAKAIEDSKTAGELAAAANGANVIQNERITKLEERLLKLVTTLQNNPIPPTG